MMSSHVFVETDNMSNPDLILPDGHDDDVEVISIGSSSVSSLPPAAPSSGPSRRRCLYPLIICVLVVALVVAVSVAVSNNNDDGRSTSLSAAKKGDVVLTDIPSDLPSLVPSISPTSMAELDNLQPTVDSDTAPAAPSATGEGTDGGDEADAPMATPSAVSSPSAPVAVTPVPSAAPTPCVDTMSVEKSCYVIGAEPIRVTFSQCDPLEDDWIGVYFAGMSPSHLTDDYHSWVWACGTQNTQCESYENSVFLETPDLPGSFSAFLVKDSAEGAPYGSVASSAAFTVGFEC